MATLTPHLSVRGAAAAMDFYKQAFGAVEIARMAAPDGKRLMYGHLKIGDTDLMLADEFPEYNSAKAPQTVGGTTVVIHISSPDVDKAMAQAAAAGATVTMPARDMFWGDRYGKLRDPFGHEWSIATPKRKLSPEQMMAAGKEAMARMDQQQQQQQ